MNSIRSGLCGLALGIFSLTLGSTALEAQCTTPTWVLTGSVVDENGVGLVGYDIDVIDTGGNPLDLSQDFTVAGGFFSLIVCGNPGAPAPGTFTILVNPPAGARYFPGSFTRFLAGSGSVDPPLALEPGVFVTGVVTNEVGTPLQQADLKFSDPVTGTLIQFSGESTAADGSFSVLVDAANYDIEFRDLPLATTPVGPYVSILFPDQVVTTDLDFGVVILPTAYLLEGSVTDSTGQLLNGADIDVRDPVTGVEVLLSGDITGSAGLVGQFSVEVPSGTWEVEIEPPPGLGLAAALRTITVTPPGPAILPQVMLPLGVPVSGTTTSAQGAVPSVDLDFIITATGVEIATADDNANALGNFSVIVVTDTYDIQFKPPISTGLAPIELSGEVINGPTNLGNVLLPPGNLLSGNVTFGGAPIEGARVTLAQAGVPAVTFGNASDTNGNYALRQVAGVYDVTATPPVGGPGSPVTVTGVNLAPNTIVDFDLGTAAPPPPVGSLSCTGGMTDVTLSWVLGANDYDGLIVERDGTQVAAIPGNQTSLVDGGLTTGVYQYSVRATRGGLDSSAAACTVTVGSPPNIPFVRGDGNQNGDVNIADAIFILSGLFDPTIPPGPCPDADDSNDDGTVNIADAIYTLTYLFSQGPPPPPPFPGFGPDPTPDALGCL